MDFPMTELLADGKTREVDADHAGELSRRLNDATGVDFKFDVMGIIVIPVADVNPRALEPHPQFGVMSREKGNRIEGGRAHVPWSFPGGVPHRLGKIYHGGVIGFTR